MDQEDPQMPERLKDLRERVNQKLQRIEGVPGPAQLNDLIQQVALPYRNLQPGSKPTLLSSQLQYTTPQLS